MKAGLLFRDGGEWEQQAARRLTRRAQQDLGELAALNNVCETQDDSPLLPDDGTVELLIACEPSA